MFASGMTNSALLNLTKSLSTEFGEDNVLVNAICPGWVATDLWVRNTEGLKKELNVTTEEEARKLAAKKNSLGRMGKPEEVANATVFLCSERERKHGLIRAVGKAYLRLSLENTGPPARPR